MSWGKSRDERPHFVASREHSQHLLHTTRTYASCPVCFMHDTRTMALESSGVGEETWPVPSRHKHWQPRRFMSIDTLMLRLLESDSQYDQRQPREPEDTVWGTLTSGLYIFQNL